MLDLPDLGPDAPAGENLENDGAFGALEGATRGKPEQQHGDLIIPAEDPDWKEVDAQAVALLAVTRDLRILQYLAVARLHLRGLTGFAEVLRVVRTQLEANWAYVHPQLDPEDDNDPTLRANALAGLVGCRAGAAAAARSSFGRIHASWEDFLARHRHGDWGDRGSGRS